MSEPEIIVTNRDAVEGDVLHFLVSFASYVVISISGPMDRAKLPKSTRCKAILYLEFHDLDRIIDPEYPVFAVSHARKILKFFEKYRGEVNALLIHCDAGISRSPAVAAALTKIMGHDDSEYFKKYIPNRRVYSLILSEFYRRN